MSIKITKAKNGDRRVHLQVRLSDKSGHSDVLDMLGSVPDDWTQSTLLYTALESLRDYKGEIFPMRPNSARITSEMLSIVNAANHALRKANEILDKVANGVIVASDVNRYKSEIASIQGKLDIKAVEGAGNYAGQVKINEDDNDDWNDW